MRVIESRRIRKKKRQIILKKHGWLSNAFGVIVLIKLVPGTAES